MNGDANFSYDGETVDISDVRLEKLENYQEMSAMVDGDRIWFRFPLFMELEPRAELFLAPAMVEGMVRGIPVRITDDIAISHRLAQTFEDIQALLKSWNDDFTISPIIARTKKDFPKTDFVISCYSGGIDSSYTYGKFRDEITHIMTMQGFDDWEEGKGWAKNVIIRRDFADKEGKKLIDIETNLHHYCEGRSIDYQVMFGSVLATAGITLNPEKFYIPSSVGYDDLDIEGSHPLLDPLWRTENTEIIHHGCAASRCGKTEYIAQFQDLLDQLQVCWRSSSSNCGQCPKCLRTSLPIKILGKKSASLPEPQGIEDYDKYVIKEHHALSFAVEIVDFARHKEGAHEDIINCLEQKIRRYERKQKFHNFIKFFAGKWGRRLFRQHTDNPWYSLRATLVSNKVK